LHGAKRPDDPDPDRGASKMTDYKEFKKAPLLGHGATPTANNTKRAL
jgi:hypothetical protein